MDIGGKATLKPSLYWGSVTLMVLIGSCLLSRSMHDSADDVNSSPASQENMIRRSTTSLESHSARFDEPDAAIEHYWRKRQGPTESHDPVVAYRIARDHIGSLPRYSTALGAVLPLEENSADLTAQFVRQRALGTWMPLGPGNIGGRTRTLVIHPDNPQIMYSGGVSGGVWKTVDGGVSWIPLGDHLSNVAVNSMAMDPNDPETVYIGTGEGYFREIVRGTWLPLRGAGIFKTTDGGESWSLLPATDSPSFHWINDLVVSTHDSNHLYAATRDGVFLSENSGEDWERILDPQVNGGCLDLVVRSDLESDTVFASCGTFEQATVYRREMATSEPWEAVLSEPGMGRTSLAIAPSDQSVIYAMAASNVAGPGGHYEQALHAVYRSTTDGDPGTWSTQVTNADPDKLNTLLLTNALGASYVECNVGTSNSWTPMGWYCNVIAVDPANPDIVWAGGVDLFRSDDGGRNWGLASYWWARYDDEAPSFVHADQHAIVFHPDYNGDTVTTMFSASDGGIFRTDNPYGTVETGEAAICDPTRSAVEFVNLNHGFGITQFYHGAPYPNGQAYLGGTQDNGTIVGVDDWGRDGWLPISGGDGGYVAIDPQNPEILYVESQRFYFKKSTDGGYTFRTAIDGITEDRQNFLFITPFVLDPNDPRILWAGGRRLWRTDSRAFLWEPASIDPLGSGTVSALAVAPGNSQIVVIGTTDGDIFRSDRALEADSETAWSSSRPRSGFVSSLAFDPTTRETIYATYAGFGGNHVWRSNDGGVNWVALDGTGALSLPDIPVHCIVVDPFDRRRLYLGTDLGVFTSINGGHTWMVENSGFANVVTEWLAVNADASGTRWLFAFTHGRGAWKVELRDQPSSRQVSGRRRP